MKKRKNKKGTFDYPSNARSVLRSPFALQASNEKTDDDFASPAFAGRNGLPPP